MKSETAKKATYRLRQTTIHRRRGQEGKWDCCGYCLRAIQGYVLLLCFEVYKPKERLKAGDEYQSKPQIAATMIRQLQAMGFQFELVLADSLYGESKVNFVNVQGRVEIALYSSHSQ